MAAQGKRQSMETILTYNNADMADQWSVAWSTTNITDLEDMAARSTVRRKRGRRRLRIGSLALSALMTMHCRVPSSALTGGLFFFMMFLITAAALHANPVRHFEVYLGQWSISGPGRAFRMIPVLDGIGIAMCINAVVRAITCSTTAAIATSYVIDSVADAQLPFTYCRDFDLKTYTPELVNIPDMRLSLRSTIGKNVTEHESVTIGLNLRNKAWRNTSYTRRKNLKFSSKVNACKEIYDEDYPPLFSTPAYNYFYVEVIKFRTNLENVIGQFNIQLGVAIIVAWLVLWSFMIIEKISYGRLIYNNIQPWLILVPWIWSSLLVAQCASHLTIEQALSGVFKLGNNRETIAAVGDALQLSLYIHSVSVGTELIHGKALHKYASGHIDPDLGGENVWHSGIVLMLAGLHSGGAAMCALVDYKHFNPKADHDEMKESTLWIMAMYSKCTSMGNYSHLASTLIFSGLVFSYLVVAFLLLKTVLHIIFEYNVKLVFMEQFIVAALIFCCMGLNLIYATNGGIALMESVDAIMTGIGMPFVVLMEMVCLLFVYRSRDFLSDMNLATEEYMCSSVIRIHWQITPIILLITLFMKLVSLLDAEMSPVYMGLAAIPLAALVLAVVLRAVYKGLQFLRQKTPNND